jgi:repressor LexA
LPATWLIPFPDRHPSASMALPMRPPRRPPGQTRERVLAFVQERLLAGDPPTVREVQAAMGFRAVQSAQQHLDALVAQGRLHRPQGRSARQSRRYRLPRHPGQEGPGAVAQIPMIPMVPILGRVQAGALALAVEDIEGYVPATGSSLRVAGRTVRDLFALRVRGESMTGAGILPGDLVLVRRQATARSGEIVVALVGDEATVKTLFVRGRRVELRPENPAFTPIVITPPEELQLLGKVVEVRRVL